MSNGLTLPFAGSLSDGGTAFRVTESGAGIAISAQSNGDDGYGATGIAVYGESDVGNGLMGRSRDGAGIQGESGKGPAIWGVSDQGRGVVGHSKATDGVQGTSAGGTGVFGEGPVHGVHGKSATGSAVFGEQTASGDGVTGISETGTGVAGVSTFGAGLYGRSQYGKAAFFDGDVEVTGDISLKNADCAEDFDAAGDGIEPGSVMIIEDDGFLRECRRAYDKRVAGVVSGAGACRPALVLDRSGSPAAGRVPIGMFGKVYCKVDAGFGAVEAGDLLTTSPTRGHAMKAVDREAAFGTVIGKALHPLGEGVGLIPILITLQ